jgi:CBS-domain-containing membrane protein
MENSNAVFVFKQKCLEILKNGHIKDLPALNVVEIDSTIGLYEGFQILLKNNIVSAPVWDPETKKYTGFLDIRDLAGFVVYVYDTQQVGDNTELVDLITHGQSQFKTATTDGISIKYLSRRNRFHPVSIDSSLFEVCEALSAPDIHRVPILGENGKVVTIISQTTIIKYLSQRSDVTFDTSADPTIGDLNIGTSPVLSVKTTESVINTFRKMEKRQKSGIAIVDENGNLVGATTAKDLSLFIKNPTLQALQGNIFDYLKLIRQEQINIINPCITVPRSDKLSRAVGLLAATRVHRIFVVDSEEHFVPVSVLSITDILKKLIKV